MPRKRHSPTQIATKLQYAENQLAAGRNLREIAGALEISEQTLNRWRKDHGASNEPVEARLKQLEQDNQQLRRVLNELENDKQALTEALQGNY